jgi:hypothetical protein
MARLARPPSQLGKGRPNRLFRHASKLELCSPMVFVKKDRLKVSSASVLPERRTGLAAQFGRGFSFWPVDRASLAVLVDLGLTDADISRYLRVSAQAVECRRRILGIARRPARCVSSEHPGGR